jgi:hypothetical protein
MTHRPYTVVLIDLPVTLKKMFACYILRKHGVLDPNVILKFKWISKRKLSHHFFVEDTIFIFNEETTYKKAGEIIASSVPSEGLHALVQLCTSEEATKNPEIHKVLRTIGSEVDPTHVFNTLCQAFDLCIKEKKCTFQILIDALSKLIMRQNPPGNKRMYAVPRVPLSELPSPGQAQTPEKYILFDEAEIYRFRNTSYIIAVLGDPGAGKSTIAASLYIAMVLQRISLENAIGMEHFGFTVSIVSADRGTPVVSSILDSSVDDVPWKMMKKTPWNNSMVQDALHEIAEQKTRSHIILVDMPGKIDNKIHSLCAACDGAILVYDYTKKEQSDDPLSEWRKLASSLDITVLAELEKHPPETTMPSHISDFEESKIRVKGVIDLCYRVSQPWDPVISFLAPLFLFKSIPHALRDRTLIARAPA